MIKVRLKEIYHASFSRSEMTNYREWKEESGRDLGNGEALCIVSLTGNQMVFVWKPIPFQSITPNGSSKVHQSEVFLSVRIRMDIAGWWEPRMLRDYANQVGLELIGLKRYEEFFNE